MNSCLFVSMLPIFLRIYLLVFYLKFVVVIEIQKVAETDYSENLFFPPKWAKTVQNKVSSNFHVITFCRK